MVYPIAQTFARRCLKPSTLYSPARHTLSLKSSIPLIAARTEASKVSHKPGSQTIPHAYQNIKEETGNVASDLAKTIAGKVSIPELETVASEGTTFLGITGAVAGKVPRHILTMGLAGALPYLGTSLSTIYLAHQAALAASGASVGDPAAALALLNNCLHIQVTYGAILISFSAALHWGFEMAGFNGTKGYPRLFMGAVPVVYAWSTLALDPIMGLVAQWLGYTGLWFADMKLTSAGWTPKWYSQYRFYLTLLVGSCIIGTVGATSYFGPSPGHDLTHHELELIRAQRVARGEKIAQVSGDVEALPAGETADAYVKLQKKTEDEQEEKNRDN